MTGNEFRQRVESVVEAFSHMMEDLQKEKRAMTKIWGKREKQLERAMRGIAGMYGDMQGIGGNTFPDIKSLEIQGLLLEHQEKEDRDEPDEKK